MPRKNALLKFKNISAVSMAGNITSAVSNVQFHDNIGLELVATGAPNGEIFVDVSSDYLQDSQGVVQNAGTWLTLDFGEQMLIVAADTILISINQLPMPWIRVRFVRSSGTGTLNGWISAKEI